MVVLLVSKSTMTTGEFKNVTNIAYDAGTKNFTITYGTGTTATYSSDQYYLTVLWTW